MVYEREMERDEVQCKTNIFDLKPRKNVLLESSNMRFPCHFGSDWFWMEGSLIHNWAELWMINNISYIVWVHIRPPRT